MKKHIFTIALILAVGLNPAAFAAIENYVITFAPEGGEGRTGGGFGTLTFDTDLNQLTFNDIAWSGLSANSTLAHIHGPSEPFPATAGVVYGLVPDHTTVGGTEGVISGTLQLTDPSPSQGIALADQLSQLRNGEWYINIHSVDFSGGEIRGHILVPEPSTWALLGLGGAVMAWRLRRRI